MNNEQEVDGNNLLSVPKEGKTPEEALAFLAGAVWAYVTIRIYKDPEGELSEEEVMLAVALKQWQNSGFMFEISQIVRDSILEDFDYIEVDESK